MKNIIYIPDKFDYFKYTKIKDVTKYYKILYDNFNEEYFYDELKNLNINKSKWFSQLSKGESTLVSVILGLFCRTKFILLDEPFDGLDYINKNILIEYILDGQENNMGLLIASHELSYLERISDKIFFLNKSADSGLGEVIDRENYVKYQ